MVSINKDGRLQTCVIGAIVNNRHDYFDIEIGFPKSVNRNLNESSRKSQNYQVTKYADFDEFTDHFLDNFDRFS